MSFKKQILVLLLAIGLLPMLLMAMITIYIASNDIESQAYRQLESIREIKGNSLTNYLQRLTTEVITLSHNPGIHDALNHFNHAYEVATIEQAEIDREKVALKQFYQQQFLPKLKTNNPDIPADFSEQLLAQMNDKDIWLQYRYIANNPHPTGEKDKLLSSGLNDEYDQYHQTIHPFMRTVLKDYGFYDLFFINAEGEVIYSVYKEADFATSLTHGPYRDSDLANVYQQAMKLPAGKFVITDFKLYRPSYDLPASFIAAPMIDRDGKRLGVLVAQFPLDGLSALLAQRKGLGETGETLLVGSDQLLRNQSYLQPERFNVIQSFLNPGEMKLTTDAVNKALDGQTGEELSKDYTGHNVLTAYKPFSYASLKWALITKINQEEALAAEYHLWTVSSIAIALMLVLVMIIAVVFARYALKPLGADPKYMRKIALAIADGDLTVNLPTGQHGNVIAALATMTQNLRDIMAKLRQSSAQQSQISQQVASATEETSMALHEQASQTVQVAGSVTQMTESAREVANNIKNVTLSSDESKQQLLESTEEIVHASASLQQVAESFEESRETVDHLVQQVATISTVLKNIQGIADQTNLLALNAAIEAARAGEQGRGFSVVADEVRSLASNTQRETVQINDIIHELETSSQSTQQELHKNVAQAKQLCAETLHTVDKLRIATSSLNAISDMNASIAAASVEQSAASENISVNVDTLSGSITQCEEAMKEIARNTNNIADSALQLDELVKKFKV